MITIRANDAGFYNLSPENESFAPNVFLGIGLNVDGNIVQNADGNWLMQEFFWSEGIEIRTTVATGSLYDLDVLDAATAEINVIGVTFFRLEDDVPVEIGSIDFPENFFVTAFYDTFREDPALVWTADFGEALAKAIGEQGLEFYGGNGNDIFALPEMLIPISGKVVVDGGAGNDQLTGTWGNDRMIGGPGNDTLFDDHGCNLIQGGGGDDVLVLGHGSIQSVAKGGWGDDTLISTMGSDRLFGNQGRDTLIGGSGNDRLGGGVGTDKLDGGDGNDILIGGRGKDVMTGGADADIFIFCGASGRDRITDFDAEEDHILLISEESLNALNFEQIGNDLRIVHSYGSIVLENFSQADITEDMFIF